MSTLILALALLVQSNKPVPHDLHCKIQAEALKQGYKPASSRSFNIPDVEFNQAQEDEFFEELQQWDTGVCK